MKKNSRWNIADGVNFSISKDRTKGMAHCLLDSIILEYQDFKIDFQLVCKLLFM
jgi:hypothetical protein